MLLKKIITFITLILPTVALAQFQLKGTVIDSASNHPLAGASVFIYGTTSGAQTDAEGHFILASPQNSGRITISYTGYRPRVISYLTSKPLTCALVSETSSLSEVVVSTGYQQIPQERSTGSFVNVDNNLINRSVSTDILSRLQDVTSGLIFNRNVPGRSNDISIRGQSTLFSNAQPLIVLDNFPYDGDLNNINPNDIDQITILKDAAAASIWGTRAGNGVIVITTKKGRFNQALKVSFNSNVTVGDEPDLFYRSRMSTSDYIDVEKLLYSKGFYKNALNSPYHAPVTPVVQLLNQAAQGQILQADANSRIDALRGLDARNDIRKYFYRKSVSQQYALALSGGTESQNYNLSAGVDRNLDNLVRNGFDRLTLNAGNTWSLLNHKLDLTTGINLTQSKISNNNGGINSINMNQASGLYPYAQLADARGNPLPIVKDYNATFVKDAEQQGLLNWQNYPLNELALADNTTTLTDYRLNAGLKYKIIPQLNAEVLYLYERGITAGRNNQAADSYFTRDLINNYTQVGADGTFTRPVPMGGIVDQTNQNSYSNDFRTQLNYSQEIGSKSAIDAIAGYEIRSFHTNTGSYRLYGYDAQHAISSPVDYVTQYDLYSYPGYTIPVPYNNTESDLTDHNLSYYANAAYTYDKRYTFSASGRFDQSNLFGVKANQKGVPLWSAGFAWNLSNESFYKVNWLPYLKLRATYGVNGNVNKGVSAYTTAYYYNAAYSPIGTTYATILNPPDPELSWERIQILNLGLDFKIVKNILTGSVEYYHKIGKDLIGSAPAAPSTGNLTYTGNNASTSGHGFDVVLNSNNLRGRLSWQTNLLFSYTATKVTSYKSDSPVASYLQFGYGGQTIPLEGRPVYAIYSYKSAGLNPSNGNPQGYLNGVASQDYSAILTAATPKNIVYNGPAQPTVFGALRNTFGWKALTVSANVTYRFGYYFRKSSVNYSTVLRGNGGSGDYAFRWQNPGDEARTQVPSLPSAINMNRENFYTFSDGLVASGNNIRLQDVSIGYELIREKGRGLPFSHLKIYLYGNNLALLWKSNKFGVDPDYQNGPPPKTLAAGLKADF